MTTEVDAAAMGVVASHPVWATMVGDLGEREKIMRSRGGNETSSMVSHADVVLDGGDVCAGE